MDQALAELEDWDVGHLIRPLTAEGIASSAQRGGLHISASGVRYHFGYYGSRSFDRRSLGVALAVRALDDLIAEVGVEPQPAVTIADMVTTLVSGWAANASRKRIVVLALESMRDAPVLSDKFGELRRQLTVVLEDRLVEYLERSRRQLREGVSTREVATSLAVVVEGGLLGTGLVDGSPEDIARSTCFIARAMSSPLEAHEDSRAAAHHAPDRRYGELDRQLEHTDPDSERGLALATNLLNLIPSSPWVMARVRARAQDLLAQPEIRATAAGRRAWVAAAQVLGMADGDRELADEAATLALRSQSNDPFIERRNDTLRTGWLLVRLERFTEALEQLDYVRWVATRTGLPAQAALADAVEAHARCSIGTLDLAITLGVRAARTPSDNPEGADAAAWGIASAIRACIFAGRLEEADELAQVAAASVGGNGLGETMLLLARATLDLARGRTSVGYEGMHEVRGHLVRAGVVNTAGWPWLEPMTAALVELGRHGQAMETVAGVSPTIERWGAPCVMAELYRSRAVVAAHPAVRSSALEAGVRILANSEAAVDRERTAHALTAARGGEPALTRRVREAAELAAAGMTNAEIARELGITSATVARHISRALRVTGTRNRTELARHLARRGLSQV